MSTEIKLGSPKKDVVKVYGPPLKTNWNLTGGGEVIVQMNTLTYDSVKFILDEKDRVMAIYF